MVHFSRAVGNILADLEHLKATKVSFRGKRVGLICEPVENGQFVVRYTDQRLNTRERSAFEELMRRDHGIPVLSTEKRSRK